METAVVDGGVTTSALLDVDGLTVRYGTGAAAVTAVDDVSLTVKPGERVALVGESGSGKTAVCLAVAGFLTDPGAHVSARRIAVDGTDLTGRRQHRLPRRTPGIAMIFQDATTSLDPVWTVGSQLRDVIRTRHGVGRRQSARLAEEWLHKVGLRDTQRVLASRPYELSGGMRQRAMIALALSGTPRLLIADEPTSALDASLSNEAMELLVELCDEFGAGLLIVSHDIRLCQGYADRMLVMYGGRLVEEGLAATLDQQARHPYTRALLRSVPTLDSATLPLLPTIPVSASGQHDPDGGCGFRPRCDRAHEACGAVPPIVHIGPDRSAACWLAAPAAAASAPTRPGLVPVAAGMPADGGE
jgi:oligopeptide/dipeptide ABC transporter ATP-binding protein